MMGDRSFFAPECLQISTIDCGVAAVWTMVQGRGVSTSYEELRDRCHTSVDGTSIDALEEVCLQHGIDVCQHLVPDDLIFEVMEGRYPLIAVLSGGAAMPHFVVVWRRVGPFYQVMDPAGGRQWMTRAELAANLYLHEQELMLDEWRGWVKGSSFHEALARSAERLVGDRSSVDAAMETGAPEEVAAIDAALRVVRRSGRRDRDFNGALFARVVDAAGEGRAKLPSALFRVESERPVVRIKAAVLLAPDRAAAPAWSGARRVVERTPSAVADRADVRAPGALALLRQLNALVGEDAGSLAAAFVAGTATITLGSALEVLCLRTAIDAPRLFHTLGTRAGSGLTFLALLVILLVLEAAMAFLMARAGRAVELKLRVATAYALARVEDRFVQSRPTSDLAQRAHALVTVRALPSTLAAGVGAVADLAVTLAAVAWFDPRYLAPALVGGALLPLLLAVARSRLRELESRNLVHASRLLMLFMDALRGLRPIRLHGYEDAFRDAQRKELRHWRATGNSLLGTRSAVEAAYGALGVAIVASTFFTFAFAHGDPRIFVLLAVWTFRIPAGLRAVFGFAQSLPLQSIAMTRLLEITERVSPHAEPAPARHSESAGGAAIEYRNVDVIANGTTLLEDATLTIRSGEHIAVVGASGSGKSTLVSLLLGFHRPTHGRAFVDDQPLEGATVEELRSVTAWIDPSVHLFDGSVRTNVEYGSRGLSRHPFLDVVEGSDLLGVVDHLQRGLDTPVGPEGTLLSGGEGQRIRAARAMMRRNVRLVVLDEAFRGLDRPTRSRLTRNVKRLWPAATILQVTHDIREAHHADRVVVMDAGKIVECDVPNALAGRDSKFRQLLDAEERALGDLWGDRAWRRILVAHGRAGDAHDAV